MHQSSYLYVGMFLIACSTHLNAQDVETSTTDTNTTNTVPHDSRTAAAIKKLTVNANAAQSEDDKDPFQPLNRQVYAMNDYLDIHIARPLAVQYVEKTPKDVRDSYRLFRKNLGEPWNAFNQLIQGRPVRAAQSLGRFTVNTLTTLGFADPASRLGLTTEDENFGATLGYYGIPSGPFIVLPIFGPSTIRQTVGLAVDSQGRPQKYMLDGHDGAYWTEQTLRGVDARSQLLDIDSAIQGDKYSQIRDIYLQRLSYSIAEKKGIAEENLFIGDEDDNFDDEDTSIDNTDDTTQQNPDDVINEDNDVTE